MSLKLTYTFICDECEATAVQEYTLLSLEQRLVPYPTMPQGWCFIERPYSRVMICPAHTVEVQNVVSSEVTGIHEVPA